MSGSDDSREQSVAQSERCGGLLALFDGGSGRGGAGWDFDQAFAQWNADVFEGGRGQGDKVRQMDKRIFEGGMISRNATLQGNEQSSLARVVQEFNAAFGEDFALPMDAHMISVMAELAAMKDRHDIAERLMKALAI